MLLIMLQKLWQKKWMNMCLLLGCILMIATVICFPLYKEAAYNRMIQDEFDNYVYEEGMWPAVLSFYSCSKTNEDNTKVEETEQLANTLYDSLGVKERETIRYYSMMKANAVSTMKRDDVDDVYVRLCSLSGFPNHAKIISGEMYSENGRTQDGAIEVVVSQACMTTQKLLVGETLEIDKIRDKDNKPVRIYIKGVFDIDENEDYYWQVNWAEVEGVCIAQEDLYREVFLGENIKPNYVYANYYAMFEYDNLKAEQVDQIIKYTNYLTKNSDIAKQIESPRYLPLLQEYKEKQIKIKGTLLILQIPVLIMLGAFLLMISGQLYDMESNEISVIKSRGSSKWQIMSLYLYQSLFLATLGGIIGVPLGILFSRILGSARSFLEFDWHNTLPVVYGREAFLNTLMAMGVVLIILTVPAVRHSRVSIVKLKQQKALKKKNLWEKLYIDVILIAVSLYGYYSFSRSAASVENSILSGESLDPLLYISSSLFILGLGLFYLRIQPYIIQLIYLLGKNRWKPASYASFMENLKNGRKQQFIMLFLILTISLGMYHATVARTILQNAIENTAYLDGADIIMREVWSDNRAVTSENEDTEFCYYEPDYSKYEGMEFAKSYTKVLYDTKAHISDGVNNKKPVTLMGIHTKEFGENTFLSEEYLDKHYYTYLNDLAVEKNGILVSENFKSSLGYSEGDSLAFSDKDGNYATGIIVGFFSYWPGYRDTTIALKPDGNPYSAENYMIVTHINTLKQNWGVTPYEVWITLKDGYGSEDVTSWISKTGLRLSKYVDREKDINHTITDPLLQGTNGILTMGFMVTIVLCAVGYLIYWILSVRAREMMFGVLRACGMHKAELMHVILNEQLFSGIFTIFAGIGIGKLASKLYVPIVQTAYAASNQVLPMKMITDRGDMLRLYGVIAGTVCICLAVLVGLIFKLNITNTLKLGEE